MTSTTGKTDTTQHPDVSEISDLTEGLLSPTRSAAVRLHLDGCPLCADVRASLEEIRGLLGTLPGPPRLPADIAGRIDAALAAEALLQATAPEKGAPVSRETRNADDEAPRPPVVGRPAGRPAAATGPGRPGKPRRRRIAVLSTLAAAFGALALGTGLYLGQSGVPSAFNSDAGKMADQGVAKAASSFSGAPIEDRVHALLAVGATPQKAAPESLAAAESDTAAPRRNAEPTALPDCVLAGTGRSDAVLGHERGQYEGTAAYLLLFAEPGDSGHVQALVLDASCADQPEGSGARPADLLLSQTYPRS
ncbi:hypothetical protein AB0G79_01255 [Streptomyces sp. NPDC020807]|uniref:hypothetical protein n=1 Tax=Streptomyces sp. NPDC020807 TaxID=3155119 RepID=UPI0033F4A055